MVRMTIVNADELEAEVIKHWRMRAPKGDGWLFQIFKRLKSLNSPDTFFEGEFYNLISWNRDQDAAIKAAVKRDVSIREQQGLEKFVKSSKHSWITEVWPDYRHRRSWEMQGVCSTVQRAWTRLALSEYILGVELGRMQICPSIGKKEFRSDRTCKVRKKIDNKTRVDDEPHILSCCASMRDRRAILRWQTVKLLVEEEILGFYDICEMESNSFNMMELFSCLFSILLNGNQKLSEFGMSGALSSTT